MVHGVDGPFFMDKIKWPTLSIHTEQDSQEQGGLGELTQEENLTCGEGSQGKAMMVSVALLGKDAISSGKGVHVDKETALIKGGGFKNSELQVVEEDFLDQLSELSKNSDMENECQGWQSPKSKKKKSKRKVVVASRTSNRLPRDGIPVATKAANRAVARNTIPGNSTLSNPFTLLNNTPSCYLGKLLLI